MERETAEVLGGKSELERVPLARQIRSLVEQNSGKIKFILGMGAASGLANFEHGITAVVTAGAKQSAYSMASAAVLLNFQNFLARRTTTMLGELSPMFLPAIFTILANYGVHSLKGTAEPLLSTMPTAILATGGFPILHVHRRLRELWEDFEKIEVKL